MQINGFESAEIDELLERVRSFNNKIGNYKQHLILPDDGAYSIKLTNGSIRIYVEELQDKQALKNNIKSPTNI